MSSAAASSDAMFRGMKPKHKASALLEEESRKMEERLHMLRKIMSVEKAARENSDGHFWKSSQLRPALQPQAPLSPPVSEKQRYKGERRPVRVKLLTAETNKKQKSQLCGQCDKMRASLVCIECVENYCVSCFAKFHQKGALSKHHVKPLPNKVKPPKSLGPAKHTTTCGTDTAHQGHTTSTDASRIVNTLANTHHVIDHDVGGEDSVSDDRNESGCREMDNGGSEGKIGGGGGGRWLLEGEYNEKASAESFQAALKEWRGSMETQETCTITGIPTTKISELTQVCFTQTPSTAHHPSTSSTGENTVTFSKHLGGVSYLEKMMLKRHHIDPRFLAPTHTAELSAHTRDARGSEMQEEDGINVDIDEETKTMPSQYNIFYAGQRKKGREMTEEHEGKESKMLPSSPQCSQLDNYDSTGMAPSVRIEAVTFSLGSHKNELKGFQEEAIVLQNNSSMSANHHSEQQKAKRPPIERKKTKFERSTGTRRKKKAKGKVQEMNAPLIATINVESGTQRTSSDRLLKSVAESHRETWAVGGVVHTPNDRYRHLSEFFLAGVKSSEHNQLQSLTDDGRGGKEEDKIEPQSNADNSYTSKRLLPISATIWLPENSTATDIHTQFLAQAKDDSAAISPTTSSHPHFPNVLITSPSQLDTSTHTPHMYHTSTMDLNSSPPLTTSVYHVETDLPPPSRKTVEKAHLISPSVSTLNKQPQNTNTAIRHTTNNTSVSSISSGGRSSNSSNEDEWSLGSRRGLEGREEGENLDDSEALEDLAWELQSMTGGRMTRCEREELEEEEEEEEEGSGDEGAGMEELEAGLERAMSSFEMYQKQLIEKDSD